MAILLRQRTLLVLGAVLFCLLGLYTWLLQARLTLEEPGHGFIRRHQADERPPPLAAQGRGTSQLVAQAVEEEVLLLKRTQELASEVAALAKQLRARRASLGSGERGGEGAAAGEGGGEVRRAAGEKGEVQGEGLKGHIPSGKPTGPGVVSSGQKGVGGVVGGGAEGGGAGGAAGTHPAVPVTVAEVKGVAKGVVKPPVVTSSGASVDPARAREAVVGAVRHAWSGYETYAWGLDELTPLSKGGKNSFGGLGATLVDSLDLLWMLGLKEEFARARDWVATKLTFEKDYEASVFETCIRVVGGLLSAFELSGDDVFLKRAEELGDLLIHAYETPTGIPYGSFNLLRMTGRNPSWTRFSSILSEMGTQQLEYIELSQRTGKPVYAAKVEGVIKHLIKSFPTQPLLPLYISPQTGKATTEQVSLGAMGDSYYEYLLKVWIYKGKRPADEFYRAAWERSMDEMLAKLVFRNTVANLTYVAELKRDSVVRHKMDHLACFIPAMMALGASHGAVTGPKAARYLQVAEDLTECCWAMYNRTATGLAAEYVEFGDNGMVVAGNARHNLLRPEALEAIFVLYRTTGRPRYREWAWQIFQAFEKHCRVEVGYAGLRDVTQEHPVNDDTMQSFWLAETLKYTWLIFSDASTLPLTEWVLNTEAHPLRVMGRGVRKLAKGRESGLRAKMLGGSGEENQALLKKRKAEAQRLAEQGEGEDSRGEGLGASGLEEGWKSLDDYSA